MVNTDDGVWVTSENGVCADSWHPHQSKIPGIRKYAEFWNREVVLNANTLEDSIDQYDSMVKEKALADPNRARPALAERLPLVGDAGLAPPVAGAADVRVRRHELRHDRAPGEQQRRQRNGAGIRPKWSLDAGPGFG